MTFVPILNCATVAGIKHDWTDKDLRSIFELFGRFVACYIHRRVDESGRNTSWATVTMGDQAAARRALKAQVVQHKLIVTPFDIAKAKVDEFGFSVIGWNRGERLFREQNIMLENYAETDVASIDIWRE